MRIGERMQEKRQLEYGNWWKPIFIDDADFPCFHLALRLIALIHVLSCAVEKVFSQLEKIDVCGNVYEDDLEVKMFSGCNGNSDIIWCQA